MELGEWIGGQIIENSDNRGSDNRRSTVLTMHYIAEAQKFEFYSLIFHTG